MKNWMKAGFGCLGIVIVIGMVIGGILLVSAVQNPQISPEQARQVLGLPSPTPTLDPVVEVILDGQRAQATQIAQIYAQLATGTPIPTTTPVGTPIPGATVNPTMAGTFATGWTTQWYHSPFRDVTDTLSDEATIETFAEPGVLLDETAAFDHMSASETPVLVPEGGYAYVAVGAVTLSHDGMNLNLYHQENNIYLVVVRGNPDDGTPADLNEIMLATGYVRGTGIYSPMPSGAYVSLGWMLQQVQASFRDPNCGRGCRKVTIVVVDLPTHSVRMWTIADASNLRNWTRVS